MGGGSSVGDRAVGIKSWKIHGMCSCSIGGARKSSEHCQGTLEQGAKLQNVHIWPCNDLECHSRMYLAFTYMRGC